MTRIHECRLDTPLAHEYSKLPTIAVCEEEDCYWQRYAVDSSPDNQRSLRALADHHARARKHRVTVTLRQQVLLIPEGEPEVSGAFPVPQVREKRLRPVCQIPGCGCTGYAHP